MLAPLQVTRGGPILMVQVENEYGLFGKDAAYMGEIRRALVDAGFDVPLFACNPPSGMRNGLRADLFQAANFGNDPMANFAKLREIQPKGPLFCSEFYPGWFDTWGEPHHTGDATRFLGDLKAMLDAGASFSIYMVHGGTTFGLWSGCDRPFKPDTSSYDYDAPISEAGWAAEKFQKDAGALPEIPPARRDPPRAAREEPGCHLRAGRGEGVRRRCSTTFPPPSRTPRPAAWRPTARGSDASSTARRFPRAPQADLEAAAIHDFGYVYLDGRRVGVLDRRAGPRLRIPARAKESTLDILVEPMGRINFGPEMADRKGLIGPVSIGGAALAGWRIYRMPLDAAMLGGLRYAPARGAGPAFWRAHVRLGEAGDTFLDLRGWGKGVVWVNGRCLGRFWDIGPTQTMYAPGVLAEGGRERGGRPGLRRAAGAGDRGPRLAGTRPA